MFESIKKIFTPKTIELTTESSQLPKNVDSVQEPPVPKKQLKPRKPRTKKSEKIEQPVTAQEQTKTLKELATLNNEPYISIVSMKVDPNDINNGIFELDFNDKFVMNLVRHGYQKRKDDTDHIIVDRWFTDVCRNIALEMYEQQVADPSNRKEEMNDLRVVTKKDLGNGRSEIS